MTVLVRHFQIARDRPQAKANAKLREELTEALGEEVASAWWEAHLEVFEVIVLQFALAIQRDHVCTRFRHLLIEMI